MDEGAGEDVTANKTALYHKITRVHFTIDTRLLEYTAHAANTFHVVSTAARLPTRVARPRIRVYRARHTAYHMRS